MKMFYFTDAMCSWCYGFSPVLKKLQEDYPGIDLQIVSGGFAPYSNQVVDKQYRDFLEYHWRNVNQRSGQYFDHAMKFVSDTFRYDTEPASRALTIIQALQPNRDFEFLSLLQKSFYTEGKDITNSNVLAGLAEEFGVKKNIFLKHFDSAEMKRKTEEGFQFSRQLGVQGFPTLLTFDKGNVKILSHGFQPYETLKTIIDAWLAETVVTGHNTGQSCNGDSCEC